MGRGSKIVARFEQLNPYERGFGPASIIKIEDVNFANGQQRELFGYAIAAKRYAFFTRTPEGTLHVEKASAHGLGFLIPAEDGVTQSDDTPIWVVEAWEWILREVFGLPNSEPSWFPLPAMMRFTITTPEVLRVLQSRQKGLPYRDRAKPSNFIVSPVIDPLGGYPVGADPHADHLSDRALRRATSVRMTSSCCFVNNKTPNRISRKLFWSQVPRMIPVSVCTERLSRM